LKFHNTNVESDNANGEDNPFRNLTDRQRHQIFEALLARSTNGRLKRNTTTIVAEQLNVSQAAVRRVWRRVKECRENGEPVDIRSKKPKNCGRKRVQVDMAQVLAIPLHRRSTIRSLARALGIKKSTLHRLFKEGKLRRHSNSLKPYLKEPNKTERLRFCISMLDPSTLVNDPKFLEMYNIIHIDEKWFYITRKNRNFYLVPDEIDPHRTVQNKNAIVKVMFLSAVARPRFDEQGNCTFDGKLGVWAFVRKVFFFIAILILIFSLAMFDLTCFLYL
jgi:transposase-like protein